MGALRITRRDLLFGGAGLAGAAVVGAALLQLTESGGTTANLGIFAGSQTMWRYLAQRKDELIAPLGHDVAFRNFPSEAAVRAAFEGGAIDVIASLPTILPAFAERGLAVQYFLPLAWLREGFPIVVPAASPARSLADLLGRRIATLPVEHPGMAYWGALVLRNYNGRLEQRFQAMPSEDPASLLMAGQADAAMVDSLVLASLRGPYRPVADLSSEWQQATGSNRLLVYGGFMARRDWIAANRRFVDDLIRVTYEAFQAYRRDRAAFLGVVAAYDQDNAPPVPPPVGQQIATYLGYDDVPPERAYLQPADVDDYRALFGLLARSGYLKSEPKNVEDLFYVPARTT